MTLLTKVSARSAVIFFCAALIGCAPTEGASMLAPEGPAAAEISSLWWVMFVIAAVVFVVVMGLLAYALFHRNRGTGPREGFVISGGGIIPLLILMGLFVFTLSIMRAMSVEAASTVRIDVIGEQFWWDVRYPDYDVRTANEIYIPAREPVTISLASDDVIHSFWVPELHGKIDLIPGQSNTITIEAAEPGEYRGQCAEFCGIQHAKMAFYVIAVEPEAFDEWIAAQQQVPPPPQTELEREGQQVFLGSSCVYCHNIEGTNANSEFGPDLTHFASRKTIGAGTLPNTRGHLAGWIIDAQASKPGNQMPPMYLDADELNALLAYMETLE